MRDYLNYYVFEWQCYLVLVVMHLNHVAKRQAAGVLKFV
jgi:hypothetical protein